MKKSIKVFILHMEMSRVFMFVCYVGHNAYKLHGNHHNFFLCSDSNSANANDISTFFAVFVFFCIALGSQDTVGRLNSFLFTAAFSLRVFIMTSLLMISLTIEGLFFANSGTMNHFLDSSLDK